MGEGTMQPLRIENLDMGRALLRVNSAIAKAIEDVMERPEVEKKRKVVLQIEIEPHVDDSGLVRADIDHQLKTTFPPHHGGGVIGILQGRELLVNDFLPRNEPNQSTILDLQEKGGSK